MPSGFSTQPAQPVSTQLSQPNTTKPKNWRSVLDYQAESSKNWHWRKWLQKCWVGSWAWQQQITCMSAALFKGFSANIRLILLLWMASLERRKLYSLSRCVWGSRPFVLEFRLLFWRTTYAAVQPIEFPLRKRVVHRVLSKHCLFFAPPSSSAWAGSASSRAEFVFGICSLENLLTGCMTETRKFWDNK